MLHVRFLLFLIIILLPAAQALPWGWNAHRFINRTGVRHLPPAMASFIADSGAFAAHAHDADARRVSGDTSFYAEGPRHYLDIDDYPDFRNIPRSLDSLIALYGWERVKSNGISPWALQWCYDSLVAQLRRGDAARVLLTASDLGHYFGDICQPLHNTRNYDGQYTGNGGIHSRYETTMLSPTYYLSALTVAPGSASYIPDVRAAAFEEVLRSYDLVAAVLRADTDARRISGWNGSGTAPAAYYQALWDSTRELTLERIGRASFTLGSLWFSAWVDAGLLTSVSENAAAENPGAWYLYQNYPNPFNPVSRIKLRIPVTAVVTVAVWDLLGRRVRTPVATLLEAGEREFVLNGEGLAGGTYIMSMTGVPVDGTPSFSARRKILLLR